MIIKIKSREECLEAGFRLVIALYGLDVANNLLKNKEDELLAHLPDDIFDSEQVVSYIENFGDGKCYYVSSGWAVSDIFVEEVIGG